MKRQILETTIREILAPVLTHDPAATFDMLGCQLCREPEGGWSFNDACYMVREAGLAEALEAARGRWEIFRLNYSPRARVSDIDALEWQPGDRSLYVECDYMSFLEIRVNYSAPVPA